MVFAQLRKPHAIGLSSLREHSTYYSRENRERKFNEQFKQPTRVGCNRTSRKTCRHKFKKEWSGFFGRSATESESGRAGKPIWIIAIYRSRWSTNFDEALKNITSIFLITGYTVDMLVQSKSLIDAAKRNGVNHIVHLGAFTLEHDAYSTVFA